MRRLFPLLLVALVLTGCASVPDSSPVQILRRVSDGEAALPPGPVDGSDQFELVRNFVESGGSSTDQHAAARRFLTPEAAADWDDSTSITVIDDQLAEFDTVPVSGPFDPDTDQSGYVVRGTALGRVTSAGSFEAVPGSVQTVVTLTRTDGQWRISDLPDGVLVPLSAFRENYRAVKVWFVDPIRRVVVPDVRYLPAYPARAQAARVMELLIAGPSSALLGTVESQLPPDASLRSNLSVDEEGALVVDLQELGDLDDSARRVLAAQVVLSLSEVNVARVRLLVDGVPLLPDLPVIGRDDLAGLSGDVQPGAAAPELVVAGGRLRNLTGPTSSATLPGPLGDGTFDVESAASTADGGRLAVVTRAGTRRVLLVGGGTDGGVNEVDLDAATMTRPTWGASSGEVWTVLDGTVVARVIVDGAGAIRTGRVNADELAAAGPIRDLRISRDGMRVAAVVGGMLYTGAVARSIDGEAAIRNIRRLRADDLGEVVAVDWRSADSISVVTRRPDRLVVQVAVDGLSVQSLLVTNLTPPLTSITVALNRPTLVTDQGGVWSFGGGEQDAWRQVLGGVPDAVPFYPG